MENTKKYADKIVSNILGKNYKKKKVEVEKEGKDVEVEWDD